MTSFQPTPSTKPAFEFTKKGWAIFGCLLLVALGATKLKEQQRTEPVTQTEKAAPVASVATSVIEQSARPLHDGVRAVPPTAPLAQITQNPGRNEDRVLACKSIEDYKRFAPIYATKSDDVWLVRRAVNLGQCTDVYDRAKLPGGMQPYHYYRVDRVEKNGFACVWVSGKSPGCFWTPAENLHYIGRGPQLSEDQFRDVRTLREKEDEMRKVSGDYLTEAQIIQHRQGDRQEEARLRSLSKQASQQADEIEERIARIEPTSTQPAATMTGKIDPADMDWKKR